MKTANLKFHTTSEMNWNIYFQAFTVRTWRKRLSNLNTFLTPHIYWGIHITICVNYNQHMAARIRELYIREDRKDDNLKLALAVGNILKNNGIDVSYTRTGDIYQTPFEKAQLANQAGVDILFHFIGTVVLKIISIMGQKC